ncbi:DUF1320 domain-containing protein [Caulobacter sp. SLTY]|uniref:gp436 family protein n=1 Tax=Caulobacter sp. SLTY TaxID=2683262 RepID=UPI0014130F05|nr:DUF1320 domain-containing protein [Caulobacter sp. SLTY]NBB17549.1 DUF1320 domain-containing protein [Caulobacter sp. SLTY]
MAYATLADLIAAFGEQDIVQLTDRADPPARLVDPAIAAEALGYADNLIDGYIGARYALPLAVAQPMLKGVAQDLAWCRLQLVLTEDAKRRQDAALATLKAIQEGKITLPGEAGAAQPAGAPATILTKSQTRIFSRDRMEGL